jgi:hypothetical protein
MYVRQFICPQNLSAALEFSQRAVMDAINKGIAKVREVERRCNWQLF